MFVISFLWYSMVVNKSLTNSFTKMEEILMAEIKFEIKETVGLLSESQKGWTKELNLISWNDREPKYDLRDWAPEHEKMGKGITMTVEELKALKDILNKMDL